MKHTKIFDVTWEGSEEDIGRFTVLYGLLEATGLEDIDVEIHECQLPQSIKEALNSGDGTYRP